MGHSHTSTVPPSDEYYWFQSPPPPPSLAVSSHSSSLTSPNSPSTSLLGPACSSTTPPCASPRGVISKPVRRRSRASKKTPITLLNANTSNFRTLVQQFTGCTPAPPSSSFAPQKGPINLNFQLGSLQSHTHTNGFTTVVPPRSSTTCTQYHQVQPQEQRPHHLHDACNFQGDCEASVCRADIDMLDELYMDDHSLHELAVGALSQDSVDDAYF